MLDPVEYYRQRQADALASAPNPFNALGGLMAQGLSGYMQGVQDKRQMDQQDYERKRQRLADQRAEEDRQRQIAAQQRKVDEDKLSALEKYAGQAALTNQGQTAASLYNQGRDLRQKLYGFAGPEIVGGLNPNLYDVETQQPMRTYGPQSMQTILGLTGTELPKPILVPQGQTALNPMTHQPFFTAPLYRAVGSDRTGRQIVDLTQAGAGTQITPAVVPAGRGGGRPSSGGSGRGRGGSGGKLVDGMTKEQRDWVVSRAKAGSMVDNGSGRQVLDKDLMAKNYAQYRQSVLAGTAGPGVVAGPPSPPPGYKPPAQQYGPPSPPKPTPATTQQPKPAGANQRRFRMGADMSPRVQDLLAEIGLLDEGMA